ncbi:MAG: non-canonical purine NTP pyrophosphatase, RdgB/HAM1 family [Synergistaceae bacterium]|nr:non-canonical purine NTP pyrophosphatase, RdgB/HAM1 family [Synergistaceae bacterium]
MTGFPPNNGVFRLLLASGNRNKHAEFADFFRGESMSPLGIELISIESLPGAVGCPNVDETGQSYEENALLKAQAWADFFRMPAIADDSGLEVHSLGGRPGIFSARTASGADENRVRWLLGELDGITDRRAHFVACIVIAFPEQHLRGRGYFASQGSCKGHIANQPAGMTGFGYDPVFIPDGYENTFSELGKEIKSTVSHRARAMEGVAQMAASVIKYWSLYKRES